MSVLVEMKVAGWSWALLPKAPHSFWSYQQKSLLFQQWFPWQCNQSRKEGGKKNQWHFRCKLYQKKMFSREKNTWSLSTAGVRTAECRTQILHRGRGHSQLPTLHRPWGKEGRWSLKHWRATAARVTRVHGTGTGAAASPRWGQPKAQSSHCTVPTALPRLHRAPALPHQVWQTLQPTLPLPAGHSCNTNPPALPAPSKEQQARTAACPILGFSGKSFFSYN